MTKDERLLGLFSGFPTHQFTDEIAEVLRENLSERESLVFISAWPENYAQNDDDSKGMHGMFAERDMAFAVHHVIDQRTSVVDAIRFVREADCIFLMGGDVTRQMKLIQDLGLASELKESHAVLLGVSAGSMNMGRYVAEVWETKAFFEGLGFTDITVKGHYAEEEWFIPVLKELSAVHPIIAMEDESAIFIKGDRIWKLGNMYKIDKGEITILTDRLGCGVEYYNDGTVKIRSMEKTDADIFYETYLSYGWHPQLETYENYYKEQEAGDRLVFVAEHENKVCGICTLVLKPTEGPWVNMGWPEIVDFGIFLHLHKKGIGSRLLEIVEKEAARISDHVFLAVGVHSGYGAAQRMYVKRGYNFDGSGVWYQGRQLGQYEPCCNDDDLLLFMSKEL